MHLSPLCNLRVWLAATATTLCLQPIVAQTSPLASHFEYVAVSSGIHGNPTPVEGVVWSNFVTVPAGTPWLRLTFAAVQLEKGSYLRISSLLDGDFMTMRQEHMPQWSYTSCYFNGNSVLVELIAGPNTQTNFVDISKVMAGDITPLSQDPETLCGGTDDRIPSSDARTGRIDPIGCTGWIIDMPGGGTDKCHLSAGHCQATGQILEFAVPNSTATCTRVHPPAAKQFAINTAGDVFVNGGVGNDYWVFRCFPNPTTGLTTFQEQGFAWQLSPAIPAVTTTLRNYGYGLDGTNVNGAVGSCTCTPANGTGTRNQTQQTHTGPLTGTPGTTLDYQFDTCGGNSGSPVQNNVNGLAIGIHTHGGCANPVGATANHGTQITHAGLQAAIVAVCSGGPSHGNDECAASLNTVNGTNGPFSNASASLSAPAFPCGFNVGNDCWFRFTAVCNGSHTFTTCTPTRNFDTVLQIFTGGCAALTSVDCNDDGCDGLGSSLTVNLTAGTVYRFRVGGYNGQSGNFDVVVESPEALIYDAGPLVTDPTGGFGGAPVSALQNVAPFNMGVFGFGAQGGVTNNTLADGFSTNGVWCVTAIELFGYQTGATAASMNGVFIEIYNGNPTTGGVPIGGSPGLANNLFTTAGYSVTNTLTGIYRATAVAPLGDTRQIQSILVGLPAGLNLNSSLLASGEYFIRYQMTGTVASGPFVPPITILGSPVTGNALQSIGVGALLPIVDATFGQGIPFRLYGTSGSLPGSFTNIGGGCTTAVLNVRGAPHIGGVVHAEVTGGSPFALNAILLGLSNPSLSFAPLCTCVQHASLDIIHIGSVYNWQVPNVAAGLGFVCYMQGDQLLDPALACDIGIGFKFALTDAVRIRFY